jgi:hypothetical protein
LSVFSCSTTKELKKESIQGSTSIKDFTVLDADSESLLYKARIKSKKNEITGLLLIKKIEADTSTHLVFLSELGINILDLKYKNDEFEIVSVKDFMDKPSLIKMIQKDFRMIVQDMNVIQDYSIMEVEADAQKVLEFKHKSQRYSYFYKEGLGVYSIRRKTGIIKTNVTIGGKDISFIGISHKGIKLDITMEKIIKVLE